MYYYLEFTVSRDYNNEEAEETFRMDHKFSSPSEAVTAAKKAIALSLPGYYKAIGIRESKENRYVIDADAMHLDKVLDEYNKQ